MPNPQILRDKDTCSNDARQLKGTQVHVRQEGKLFIKPSLLRPKRSCILVIDGYSMKITTFNPYRLTQIHSLKGAKVWVNEASLRLTLSLESSQVLNLFTDNLDNFVRWRDAFFDVLHWGIHRFYQLFDQIGHGAFATVRKARHRLSGETFAVKIIDKSRCTPNDLRYFQREVNIALLLSHPNVANAIELFQNDTTLFIVLELIPGGTLKEFVEKHGPVDEDTARAIMTDLLKAIRYVHSKGVVHRDVKVRHQFRNSVSLTDVSANF